MRDQGNCGSCWAFGTVGSLESAILIQDGVSKDLAEQYLVSCNTDGWGCNGGWWAHDYHEWKFGPVQAGPGAVYESDFPYTATDAPARPYPHHETIADWVYIGSDSSVPSTDAIKQAISTMARCRLRYASTALSRATRAASLTRHCRASPSTTPSSSSAGTTAWGPGACATRGGPTGAKSGYMWIAYGKNICRLLGQLCGLYRLDTPPAAPSGLTATAASSSQINLTWTDNANNEAGFKIERCTGAGCTTSTQIATVGANVTTYSNTGLAASTTYILPGAGVQRRGRLGLHQSQPAPRTPAAPALPAAPTNLTATAVSRSQINLAWTDNADNETGFRIERCKDSTCTNFTQIATVGANVTTYSNTGTEPEHHIPLSRARLQCDRQFWLFEHRERHNPQAMTGKRRQGLGNAAARIF